MSRSSRRAATRRWPCTRVTRCATQGDAGSHRCWPQAMGLSGFAQRNPATLSGGEKKRLLLSCLEAIGPGLWILDESLGELDQEWKVRVLEGLVGSGRTVIAMDSRWSDLLRARGKSFALLRGGRITAAALRPDVRSFRPRSPVQASFPARAGGRASAEENIGSCVLTTYGSGSRIRGFCPRYRFAGAPPGGNLRARGRNGRESRRSAVSSAACSPDGGASPWAMLRACEQRPGRSPAAACGSFQNPDHQIYLPTVSEELSLGLKRRGAGKPEIERMVAEAIELFRLPDPEAPPALMSYGARRRLQAATYYLLRRDFLILDEVDPGSPTTRWSPCWTRFFPAPV